MIESIAGIDVTTETAVTALVTVVVTMLGRAVYNMVSGVITTPQRLKEMEEWKAKADGKFDKLFAVKDETEKRLWVLEKKDDQ